MGDLDDHAIDSSRVKALQHDRLPSRVLFEPAGSLIENLHLREGADLERAADLLFHPSPHRFVSEACVRIGCFRGSELLFRDLMEGNLFAQVERTMDLLFTKYTRGLVSYDGIYRIETFPVPREAMRDAVINAIIHRDYASPTTIQVRVQDDLIHDLECRSPGYGVDLRPDRPRERCVPGRTTLESPTHSSGPE